MSPFSNIGVHYSTVLPYYNLLPYVLLKYIMVNVLEMFSYLCFEHEWTYSVHKFGTQGLLVDTWTGYCSRLHNIFNSDNNKSVEKKSHHIACQLKVQQNAYDDGCNYSQSIGTMSHTPCAENVCDLIYRIPLTLSEPVVIQEVMW